MNPRKKRKSEKYLFRALFLGMALFCTLVIRAGTVELKLFHWTPSNGLPGNGVFEITQEKDGFLLVKTEQGYFKFDGVTFKQVVVPGSSEISNDPFSKKKSSTMVIHEISLGNISLQLKVQLKDHHLRVNNKEIAGQFNHFIQSKDGRLWVTSSKGMGFIDLEKGIFIPVGQRENYPEYETVYLREGTDGKIWFDMPLNGVGFWDPQMEKVFTVKNIASNNQFSKGYDIFASLTDLNVASLFFDRNGGFWIGTQSNGLFRIRYDLQEIQLFQFDYRKRSGLAHKDISFPLVTRSGDVWIGTWGGGINIWDKEAMGSQTPLFHTILPQPLNRNGLRNTRVFPLLEDREQNLWCGTFGGGLHLLTFADRQKQNYRFKLFSVKTGHLPSDSIWALHQDSQGDIWCGTLRGLARINPYTGETQIRFDQLKEPDLFRNQEILMVTEHPSEVLWISTRAGFVFRWDQKNNQIKQYVQSGSQPLGYILCSELAGKDSLWFGGTNGLFFFNREKDGFDYPSVNNELPSKHIESMLKGLDHNLWIGTGNGLVRLNPGTQRIKTYQVAGGIMSNNFTQGASKDSVGFLYFGSRNGFYRFNPLELETASPGYPIVLTDLYINGVPVAIDSLLQEAASENDKGPQAILLPYNQNTLSLEYRCLNFSPDESVVYQVMLEGHDEKWQETYDSQRTWSNLAPGTYLFQAKVKNNTPLVQLAITIDSPWWRRQEAQILMALLVVGILLVMIRWFFKSGQKREQKKQKELFDRMRFRFFLNVSHEIRTPLSLIKGAVDRLIDQESNHDSNELNRVKRNTDRLVKMVNEVLDLKKLEEPTQQANKRLFNLTEFIKATADAFRVRGEEIPIDVIVPAHPVWISSDREMIETILYNLLSNAIKFSPSEERVVVELIGSDASVAILVRDQGPGIPKEEKELIFERFYQGSKTSTKGSGIGLSLSREYAYLLGGDLTITSTPGKGSTFMLRIPEANVYRSQADVTYKDASHSGEFLQILIVEDQEEVRTFLRETFEKQYRVFEAENGEEALNVLESQMPDLIITDLMMPVMDGLIFSGKVRENFHTSHIPIIMLTAKTGDNTEVQAYQKNIDAFIAKPFSERLLISRVDQLIEQRRFLKERFATLPEEPSSVLSLSKKDQEFLDKVETYIMENIENPELSVESLSVALAKSSSGLYRKVKDITGSAPVEFIRLIRLKEAARMLKETSLSVTEIAEQTGFSNPKYFSVTFKKQFNISPLKYRKS